MLPRFLQYGGTNDSVDLLYQESPTQPALSLHGVHNSHSDQDVDGDSDSSFEHIATGIHGEFLVIDNKAYPLSVLYVPYAAIPLRYQLIVFVPAVMVWTKALVVHTLRPPSSIRTT
jgi:hypothetical protein